MFRVLIRKHKSEAIVRPPFEFIPRGGHLDVRNGTNDDIIVTVPDGVFDPARKGKLTRSGGHIVAAGDKLKLRVKADAERGAYSYTIFCNETHSYAQANSDPEFIVE